MDLFDEKITEIEDIEKKKILVSNVYLMMNKIMLCQCVRFVDKVTVYSESKAIVWYECAVRAADGKMSSPYNYTKQY